jgi:hypothetical protein
MKHIAIITVFILSIGCTGRMNLMQHPTTGDVQKCEVTASQEMATGAFLSGRQQARCVQQWQKLGYVEVK